MALTVAGASAIAPTGVPDPLALLRDARVLLVTPHPDDESLAAGGLIQHALHQGAQVRVLQVTDGDNNPWPQRVLERRVVIGPSARRRWAERRRHEVQVAVAALGLTAQDLQHMSWPDMGVTRRLRQWGVAAIEAFEQPMRSWQPSLVVLPALGDTHPDHGSVHVLTGLALARMGFRGTCLEYLIHGRTSIGAQPLTFELDTGMQARKREAVLAHQSQVALSRKRLLARVGPREDFGWLGNAADQELPDAIPLPWTPPQWLARSLHLTLAHANGVQDWPLHRAPLQRATDGQVNLVLPDDVPRHLPVFARLDMRMPSPWIFDHWGWRRLTASAGMAQA